MKAKNRQERYKKGYVLLEGKRLIADAIQAGADLLTIFVTDRQLLDVSIHGFLLRSIGFPADLSPSISRQRISTSPPIRYRRLRFVRGPMCRQVKA